MLLRKVKFLSWYIKILKTIVFQILDKNKIPKMKKIHRIFKKETEFYLIKLHIHLKEKEEKFLKARQRTKYILNERKTKNMKNQNRYNNLK